MLSLVSASPWRPLMAFAAPASAQTLKAVKDRGVLNCGVSQGVLGFSTPDGKGGATGFDADFCRAVAAAVLGDGGKVSFVPLSTTDRFTALKSGQIDLLSRNSTWTLSRETEFGLSFPPSPISTDRASCCRSRATSRPRWNSAVRRFASRPARRRTTTSPISSRPTE